jgi:glutathione synthase/RimK-type ligase-like ATP-grasp enzyme
MHKPPFLSQNIDSVIELSALDDPIARLLNERTRRNISTAKIASLSDKHVLILTHDYDPEVTLLTIKLRSRGIPCIRLNTNDIPDEQVRVRYSIGPGSPKPNIEFALGQQEISPSRVSAVLLRQFDLKEANFYGNEFVREYSLQQWTSAFQILQGSLGCKWINSPEATIQANDCIRQLSAAKAVGFDIPETLITNDPTTAMDFCSLHDGNIIVKGLNHHDLVVGNKLYSTYARPVRDFQLLIRDGDLAAAPCVWQQKITKRSELRITVIGEKVFAAELGSKFLGEKNPHNVDIHHYLSDSNFPIKKVDRLSDKIVDGCIKLAKSLGLEYAAIDFAIDREDYDDDGNNNNNNNTNAIFLEINPTGEWYWIESKTGLRMTDAMADLIEGCIH